MNMRCRVLDQSSSVAIAISMQRHGLFRPQQQPPLLRRKTKRKNRRDGASEGTAAIVNWTLARLWHLGDQTGSQAALMLHTSNLLQLRGRRLSICCSRECSERGRGLQAMRNVSSFRGPHSLIISEGTEVKS